MKLNKLSLKDKELFNRYLNYSYHQLSVYHFANIYIWKGLFDIRWQLIEKNLCVFFQSPPGAFLYLPPLGKQISPTAVKEAFAVMAKLNHNKNISRIENIEEKNLPFYLDLGYKAYAKFGDYLYLRADLAKLSGNRFKAERSLFNYFSKNYHFQYLPYNKGLKEKCLKLFRKWMLRRKTANPDRIYQGMLEDSFSCFKILLDNYAKLGLIGRAVKAEGKLAAFTFACRLNNDTLCVLYEVSDFSFKGAAQFIFSMLCRQLKEYKYINAMDDSGLENLKKAKASWHPLRITPNYIVSQKDG